MVLETLEFKKSCKKILDAVSNKSVSDRFSATVELQTIDNKLYMSVTNKEYYVTVITDVGTEVESLHVVLDAKLFLDLVSKITTSKMELVATDKFLMVMANGTYKLNLICDEFNNIIDTLPRIEIDNVTSQFDIKNENLQDIYKYNSKQLLMGVATRPTHTLFYLDNEGCITYNTGACVTNFTLSNPVKILLTEKVIKLFKLFSSEDVEFTLGYGLTTGGVTQSRVRFKSDDVIITSILPMDAGLITSIPTRLIRDLANSSYKYVASVDKDLLLSAIDRLELFSRNSKDISVSLTFDNDEITIKDKTGENSESVSYVNSVAIIDEEGNPSSYVGSFFTKDLKLTLESCDEQYVNIKFGNGQSIVIERGNVKNIVPEKDGDK